MTKAPTLQIVPGGPPSAALQRRIKRQVLSAPQSALIRFPRGFGDLCYQEVLACLAALRLKASLEPKVSLTANAVAIEGIGFGDLLGLGLSLTTSREILWEIAAGRADTALQLKNRLAGVDWPLYLAPGTTLGLRIASTGSRLFHEGRIRDTLTAILAPFQVTPGLVKGAAHLLDVRLLEDRLQLALSLSGRPLYQRRYKQDLRSGASVKEDLAAGATRQALAFGRETLGEAWRPDAVCIPFSGSGTLAFEALIALDGIPPSLFFGPLSADQFPCSPEATLRFARRRLVASWLERRVNQPAPLPVFCCDLDPAQVEGLQANIASFNGPVTAAGGEPYDFHVATADVYQNSPVWLQGKSPFLALNPPYGERLEAAPAKAMTSLGKAAGRSGAVGYALLPAPLAANFSRAAAQAGSVLQEQPISHGGKRISLVCFRGR